MHRLDRFHSPSADCPSGATMAHAGSYDDSQECDMDITSMMKSGVTAVLGVGIGLSLVACGPATGNAGDATDDDVIVATSATDEKLDDDDDPVAVDESKDATDVLPMLSEWEVDESDPSRVTMRDPRILSGGERKIVIETIEDPNGMSAKDMASDLVRKAAVGLASARMDEVPVDRATWYVFRVSDTNGVAFYETGDGTDSIRKVTWYGCSIDEVSDAFVKYQSSTTRD